MKIHRHREPPLFGFPCAMLPLPPVYPRCPLPSQQSRYQVKPKMFGLELGPSSRTVREHRIQHTIQHRLIRNDGTSQSLIWLNEAKNIFNGELCQMSEAYISRLVFDPTHWTIILLEDGTMAGALTFRLFEDRGFAEIAFTVIPSWAQIGGYGSHMMGLVKRQCQSFGIRHILAYADATAVEYFKRQGFTREIKLPREVWQHCIKDYTEAVLVHCSVNPDIDFEYTYDYLDNIKAYLSYYLPNKRKFQNSRYPIQSLNGIPITERPQFDFMSFLRGIHKKIKNHSKAWPFLAPVRLEEAPDYFDYIDHPMDLSTIGANIARGRYCCVTDLEDDLRLMIANCKTYNPPDSVYYKAAEILDDFITDVLFDEAQ